MSVIRSICVFCGSSAGRIDVYRTAAESLARTAVERKIELIYGGGRVGLMGVLADAALAVGGRVVGVIPQALAEKELAHAGCTELHVVPSMHRRKALMAERADAFVALPGGLGTLEELFEVWTWSQLGLHHKPCGLLNAAGYFDRLLDFLRHATDEGFVAEDDLNIAVTAAEPIELLDRLERHRPPEAPVRLRREET